MFWKVSFLERRWFFISCFLFTVSCSQSLLFPVSKSPVSTFDTFLNFHSFQSISSFHFPAFSQPISCRECWFFENTTHYSEELDGTPCRRRMARFRAISRSIDEVHFWVVSKKKWNKSKGTLTRYTIEKMHSICIMSRVRVCLQILQFLLQLPDRPSS